MAFPRCDTERTVPWSTVVVFDANQVDQPWRPSDGPGATETTGTRPGTPSGAISKVAHTTGAANAPDTVDGAPAIGSRIGKALVLDALFSPGPKRLPQSIAARTTARVGADDWRRNQSFAEADADWTRAQEAQGHHRTHDSRWCVRTAAGLEQVEPDGDVFLQAQRDAQSYHVGDSVFLEVKSGQWVPAMITATKLDGYRIQTDDGVHTKWGSDQWFLAEQLSIYPRRMEGVRGQLDTS